MIFIVATLHNIFNLQMSITLIIIIFTSALSIFSLYNPDAMYKLILNPYQTKSSKEWYRLVSSGFIHADWMHLFVNMFVLYSFGNIVEYYYQQIFGEIAITTFLMLYISSIFAANLPTYYKYQNHSGYNSLGASGATSAVLFASILFQPFAKIYLYFIPIPGILAGVLYLFYSHYMDKRQVDNVNHDAHFWGAVYGVAFTVVLKPKVVLIFLAQLGIHI